MNRQEMQMQKRTSPQWAAFGYEPVRGLANRYISRWLRTQRKNMRRLFQERGLYVFADRMNQIRKSRQGMLEKNRMFQAVLNDYAKLSSPPVVSSDVPGVPEGAGKPAQGIATDEAGNS